jgi:hypothetical protein
MARNSSGVNTSIAEAVSIRSVFKRLPAKVELAVYPVSSSALTTKGLSSTTGLVRAEEVEPVVWAAPEEPPIRPRRGGTR